MLLKSFVGSHMLFAGKPKSEYGNTNDGNTASSFFMISELSGVITWLNVIINKKFCVLLRTLSSGFEINFIKSEKDCSANHYLKLYSW